MTLIIDREADEVRDKSDGTVIGPVPNPGGPYQKPADAMEAVKSQFPSDHSSVSVQDLIWTLDATGGDVEWANPGQ